MYGGGDGVTAWTKGTRKLFIIVIIIIQNAKTVLFESN